MISAADLVPTPPELEPQILLFAPYCGGVAYRHLLQPAVAQLHQGEWRGERRLADGRSHPFTLCWQGEPAPLEPLACTLTFPQLPDVGYSFTIPACEVVYWLMQREDGQFPQSFWRWLLTGEQPVSTEPGS
ncbi:MAG: transglycosylase [Cyanobium sp. M30B3]|nr:MAG: transglycosylase [Cyanobium sp. M30B3]